METRENTVATPRTYTALTGKAKGKRCFLSWLPGSCCRRGRPEQDERRDHQRSACKLHGREYLAEDERRKDNGRDRIEVHEKRRLCRTEAHRCVKQVDHGVRERERDTGERQPAGDRLREPYLLGH